MPPWPTRSAPTAGRFALDFAGKIRYPIRQTIAKGKESIMVFGFLQNIGPWQLLIVVAVIALLFGGSKIPELARSLGKAKGEFKKGLAEGEKEEEEAEKKPAKELEKA